MANPAIPLISSKTRIGIVARWNGRPFRTAIQSDGEIGFWNSRMPRDRKMNVRYCQVMHDLQKAAAALDQSLREQSKRWQRFQVNLERLLERHKQTFQLAARTANHVTKYFTFVDSVKRTGWLPHHSVSMDLVDECGNDSALLDLRLAKFYETNWTHLRQDIKSRLEQYHISEESRSVFREAIVSHEIGHFRSVCRVLFPEIEREFRIRFFQDRAGQIPSKKMLEELERRLRLETVLPREAYGWILFERLTRHLYEQVDDDNRKDYEKDHVPNRHAALHGLVSYSTFKHSMNMIIMADYIFQVLTSVAHRDLPRG